jgi:hypothetical protein
MANRSLSTLKKLLRVKQGEVLQFRAEIQSRQKTSGSRSIPTMPREGSLPKGPCIVCRTRDKSRDKYSKDDSAYPQAVRFVWIAKPPGGLSPKKSKVLVALEVCEGCFDKYRNGQAGLASDCDLVALSCKHGKVLHRCRSNDCVTEAVMWS